MYTPKLSWLAVYPKKIYAYTTFIPQNNYYLFVFVHYHVWLPIVIQCVLIQVDGHWSHWSAWSDCDVTCGNGNVARMRNCSNPSPQYGGINCTGNDIETKTCNLTHCPGYTKITLIYYAYTMGHNVITVITLSFRTLKNNYYF